MPNFEAPANSDVPLATISQDLDCAAILAAKPLRVGISTRALFLLEEEHKVFQDEGVDAYIKLQRGRENQIIEKGAGFDVVDRLLKLNDPLGSPLVEVVLLSRNSPDLSIRAFKSIAEYGLCIKTGSFTAGRPLIPYIPAWGIDLFLSNETEDVKGAVAAGTAAARLGPVPTSHHEETRADEVRIAFDGDAVVFSEESDEIYKQKGLEAFLRYEEDNAQKPMAGGPFGEFLKKLSLLRKVHLSPDGTSRVRIAIVTARNAPAHARVVYTLRAWGTPADEAHFVGTRSKASILEAVRAHIFFDDQEKHVLGASQYVPAGLVPGPHAPGALVLPAG